MMVDKRIRLLGVSAVLALCGTTAWGADANFNTTHFSGSGNCAVCHDGLSDQNNRDVSIQKHWSGSMMANAARDPLWKAKLASELKRNAHLTDVLNDKCTACHAPMANYEAKRDGATIDVLGSGGLLDPANPYHDAALDGVSCTLCHQIQDDPSLGTLESASGHYQINPNKEAYGQFIAQTNPMLTNSGYTPTFSAHVSDSSLCATCHDLKTPFVDSEGNLMSTTPESEFPEQMVYSEWQFSDYAQAGTLQSCQDCHMPHTDGVKMSNRPRQLAPRDGFAEHQLVGANTVMMNLLQENSAELGVTSANLPTSIQNARNMLQGAAQLEVVSTGIQDGLMDVVVQVTNTSGHKLPTSYPSRRAFLHFTVRDSQGQVIFESGRLNADGSIEGSDGDLDPARYEPHYDLITSADQVQIYEPIMGDTDAQVTYTLLRGAGYLKDNRLLPAGFDKHGVPDDIMVRGAALDDPDFIGGSDLITYRVPVSADASYTVDVELIYQPLQYGYLRDLYQDVDQPEVADFKRMYEQAAIKWEVITAASAAVTGSSTAPANAAPTASFTVSCIDLTCDFDATASADSGGSIVSYAWDLGDGATADTPTVTHTYGAADTYTVTVTVTDDAGASASTTREVTVSAALAAEMVIDSLDPWLLDGTDAPVSQTSVFKPGDRIGILSRLLDQDGIAVEGASVTLEIRDAESALATTLTATSDALGDALAIWQTEGPSGRGRFATAGTPTGTYTAKVADVVKDGYTLNLDLSVTTVTFAIQ
jgi:PKD repeat protein